ncbi:MAG: hypothetical protein CBE36_06940 [Oceanospirillaceae bacterium TMED276]|nr:MAG: hypothetical protein CBE36_06940 [Oceanospirillaceae bacterium TMED276]
MPSRSIKIHDSAPLNLKSQSTRQLRDERSRQKKHANLITRNNKPTAYYLLLVILAKTCLKAFKCA